MIAAENKTGWLAWPPLIYLAAIALSTALGLLYPLPWIGGLLGHLLFAIGWLILLGVVALWFTTYRGMAAEKTTIHPNGIPTHLITSGPFLISRNPIYLANTLLLIGIGLIGGMVWFLLLAFVAAFATSKLAIQREEKILSEKFGKKYRDYAKKVRRWI